MSIPAKLSTTQLIFQIIHSLFLSKVKCIYTKMIKSLDPISLWRSKWYWWSYQMYFVSHQCMSFLFHLFLKNQGYTIKNIMILHFDHWSRFIYYISSDFYTITLKMAQLNVSFISITINSLFRMTLNNSLWFRFTFFMVINYLLPREFFLQWFT